LDKKQIAALTAVLLYLRQETEIRNEERSRTSPYTLSGRWTIYGRQTIMHMRSRVQRRIVSSHIPLPFISKSVTRRGILLYRVKNLIFNSSRLKSERKASRQIIGTISK